MSINPLKGLDPEKHRRGDDTIDLVALARAEWGEGAGEPPQPLIESLQALDKERPIKCADAAMVLVTALYSTVAAFDHWMSSHYKLVEAVNGKQAAPPGSQETH